MTAYAALLRAVNLGGHHKLPMKELAAIVADLGATDVRTYIQSGNVVFRADPALAAALPAGLRAAISARFGFAPDVILRTAEELRAVAADNPFLAAGAAPETLHVTFLADVPAPERVAALDPARVAPDAYEIRGRDIYMHLPNGVGRSKLGGPFFAKLGTPGTARNWRTVLALIGLTAS